MLARIDDFDTGTIWEMGYAAALGKPVVAYTTYESGRGLNLMLAKGCVGFVQGLNRLHSFLKGEHKKPVPNYDDWSYNDTTKRHLKMSVSREWNKEIF